MSFRRVVKDLTFFNAQATNGSSSLVEDVSDFRNCVFRVVSGNSFAGSLYVVGAIGQVKPTITWGAGGVTNASINNPWDFVEVVDLQDGSAIAGDTAIELRGVTDVRQYEVNINALDWLTFLVTSRTAGTISVAATITTNA